MLNSEAAGLIASCSNNVIEAEFELKLKCHPEFQFTKPIVQRRLVDAVKNALMVRTYVDGTFEPPFFLGTKSRIDLSKKIVTSEGLFDPHELKEAIESGRFTSSKGNRAGVGCSNDNPTRPRLFNLNGIRVSPDLKSGRCPAWLEALGHVVDGNTAETVQELFSYVLTSDTSYGNMFVLTGPESSTDLICRMLRILLGDENACYPFVDQLGKSWIFEFMQPHMAVFCKYFYMPKSFSLRNRIINNLIKFSMNRPMTIERKPLLPSSDRKPTIRNSKSSTKMIIVAETLTKPFRPGQDLGNKFTHVKTTKELPDDPSLLKRLVSEREAVLAWALAGHARLQSRGGFIGRSKNIETLATSEPWRPRLLDRAAAVVRNT
ncbi:hypothetical protein KIH39_04695 [Telmatocola sphagniphila]|uniref:Uncharacterized protein n=1 Tax=Telmatocola sphagniphila TaxID=1123043 RepID=A0A8E6B8H5_9BACT|nr:hypothetical protein [Telmatocola sphagniphila]QVL33219.1 hypothetical protein KIH39_04695 [Telmatocola sphagniphila]